MQHRRSKCRRHFWFSKRKLATKRMRMRRRHYPSPTSVNIFVANAAQFLNSFSALCRDKLSLVHRKMLTLDASLTLLESQLRGVQEEPSGMSEASHRPTENVVMSKDKSLVPDKLSDVVCSSSEPSRWAQ